MSAVFDWAAYDPEITQNSSEFNWASYDPEIKKSEKLQEPVSLKGAAGSYGTGLAAGAGGLVPDITKAIEPLSPFSSGVTALNNLIKVAGLKTTHELGEKLGKEYGIKEPQNALERILKQSGEFGGQEALIGTAAGGPVGGGLGALHGSASGALYGGLKELGLDDNWALGLTALTTLSPIAARELLPKLIDKFKKGVSFDETLAKAVKSETPPSPPPPPSGGKPTIEPKGEIPQAKGAFELKEEIQEALKPAERKLPEIKPLGIEHEVRAEKPRSLEGRVTKDPALGNVVSKESFHTEAEGGRKLSSTVKENAAEARKPVDEAYKKAKEITSGHVDIYPELAEENSKIISDLEQIQKRNSGEEAVYQQALAIRSLVGETDALVAQNAARLIAQSDSMSQLAKYELPYVGYKGRIKTMVKQTNNAVIDSLNRAGKDSAAVIKADKMYGQWADAYFGDELVPYLNKKILNPEQLLTKAIDDPATYRALKKAIGSRKSDLINKIDRDLVVQKMDKYYKDLSKVNSEQYQKDLSNLSERIGKEKTAEVDHFLRNKQASQEKLVRPKQAIREAAEKAKQKSSKTIKERVEERVPKIEEIITKPEDVDKFFKSRSGIRDLRKRLKEAGQEAKFEKITEDKIVEIFREGKYGGKKLTGKNVVDVIDNNHEILNELMGEEVVNDLYKVGKEHLDKEVKLDMIKNVGKRLVNMVIPFKALKIIFGGAPI